MNERDLRKFSSQTNRRLLIGFFVLLFLVGDGLVWLIFGRNAAIVGVVCIVGALVPALLVAALLGGLGWIARKANGNDE
jgi:hypothetical protein